MAKYHGKKVADLKNGGKDKKREFLIALLTGCAAATVYADQPRDIRNSYRDLSKTARASQYPVIRLMYILHSA